MRIISKFHDYYDTAMGHGIDMSCVYERNTIASKQDDLPAILEKKHRSYYSRPLNCSYSRFPYFDDHGIVKCYSTKIREDGFEAFPVFIGYCGKFYLGYHIKGGIEGYFYDYESLRDFFAEHKIEFTDREIGCFRKAFDEKLNDGPGLLDFFHECNVPVIAYVLRVNKHNNYKYHDGYDYIVNPCLKDYQFYKVFDAYSAYQELSMFVCGVLRQKEVDTLDIDDKTLRDEKGFDEWSFKRHKLDVTKKRKLNKR